jgi:hypothetical protein
MSYGKGIVEMLVAIERDKNTMLRSFSAVLAPVVGLLVAGVTPAEASEVSEVTIQSGRSGESQMHTAHAVEYAPSAPSEVTLAPASAASPSQVIAGTEPYPGESTVSEVTIQPGPVAPVSRAGKAIAAGGSPPDAGIRPAVVISPPKTK